MRTIAKVFAVALFACSSESTTPRERTSSPNDAVDGGGSSPTEAGVDPSGGRDDTAASCFAACQNTSFTCQAKTGTTTVVTEVLLNPVDVGCAGTSTKGGEDPVAFELHCIERKVCTSDEPGTPPSTCVPATFSALSFGYTPSGSVLVVCTRN